MAGNVINTLFPPNISTFLPAFPNTQDAVIYFSLSPFNSASEIQRVHVSLVNQLNNENALANPSGVLIQNLRLDTDSGLYYVVIPPSALKEGNTFNINQYYKVQVRFDSFEGTIPGTDVELNYYLLNHQQYFSEWSTICLIKAILQPNVYLRKFEGVDRVAFNKGIIPISGLVIFGNNSVAETESMQSYQIQILEENDDKIVYETKEIYTGDTLDMNSINTKIDLQHIDIDASANFRLRVNVITTNQYQFHKDYDFSIANYVQNNDFNPTLTVTLDEENGIAHLHIANDLTVAGTLYVKRGSSIDNFQTWESISTTRVNGNVDMTIDDNTIGSLVWYRYSVQLENSSGAFTELKRSEKFMPQFYDAILSRGTRQLAIRYDFTITNFKPVVNRAKIDTLGGRYPRFAENAILNYKQFSISGYISSESDFNQLFLNQTEYLGENTQNYTVYKAQNGIKDLVRNDVPAIGEEPNRTHMSTVQDDWMWERDFREQAIEWLNDGEPKLFRSMTEGVIPVMLTDITLTPNKTLGRRLWTFSATAYEIADGNSLTTLDSLGIIDIPKIEETAFGTQGGGDDDIDSIETIRLGQIYQEEFTENKNNIIASVIGPRLIDKYAGVLANRRPDSFYLKSVKIQYHNRPNIFLPGNNNELLLVTDPSNSQYTDAQRERMLLGYTFEVSTDQSIGSQKIFVNSRGFYQLPDNLNVTEISFPQTTDIVTIDYVVVYKERPSENTIISGSSLENTVVGQETGIFTYNTFLSEQIRAKYNYVKTNEFYQQMSNWKGISLDVNPYAIAHIKYQNDTDYKDYIVGQSGTLNLLKDFPVIDMCFKGIRMLKATDEKRIPFLEEWEYYKIPTKYVSIDSVVPQRNCVYSIGGKLQIYYNNEWYEFQENDNGTGNAYVPVSGMINFVGDIIRNSF